MCLNVTHARVLLNLTITGCTMLNFLYLQSKFDVDVELRSLEMMTLSADQSSTRINFHECVNTVSLRLCLEYCQSCQSCQFDQLVTLYLETNTFNLNIQVIFHHF